MDANAFLTHTDYRENRTITIRGKVPFTTAVDRLLPTDKFVVKENAVTLEVPAGGVRILETNWQMYGNNVNLLYVLAEHGWSDVLLYVGCEIHCMQVSHVFSDPTAELMRLATNLHIGVKSIEVLFWDEPGGHALQFEQLQQRHDMYAVKLSGFPESFNSALRTEKLLVEFNVKGAHFVNLIRSELAKTLLLLEEKSYRMHRDFPYKEYEQFRKQFNSWADRPHECGWWLRQVRERHV